MTRNENKARRRRKEKEEAEAEKSKGTKGEDGGGGSWVVMEVVFSPVCCGAVHVHGTKDFGFPVVETKEIGGALCKARHKGTPLPLLHRLCQGDGWYDTGGFLEAHDASNLS